MAWHSQVTLENGAALVCGGLLATGSALGPQSFTVLHDGTSVVAQSAIGLNPGISGSLAEPRGAMSVTPMHDGALLFLGGSNPNLLFGSALASGFVYTPRP